MSSRVLQNSRLCSSLPNLIGPSPGQAPVSRVRSGGMAKAGCSSDAPVWHLHLPCRERQLNPKIGSASLIQAIEIVGPKSRQSRQSGWPWRPAAPAGPDRSGPPVPRHIDSPAPSPDRSRWQGADKSRSSPSGRCSIRPVRRGAVIAPDQARPNTGSGAAMPARAEAARADARAKGAVSATTPERLCAARSAPARPAAPAAPARLSRHSALPVSTINAAMVGCR